MALRNAGCRVWSPTHVPSMKMRRPSRKLSMCFLPSFTMKFLVASTENVFEQ
jgi:hypothetical protein